MSSRFNTLYLGSPADAADVLEHLGATHIGDEVRVALVNALRRIAVLEGQFERLGLLPQDTGELG